MVEEIKDSEDAIVAQLRELLEEDSTVFLFDSHLRNKHLLHKVVAEKRLKLKTIKTSNPDHKNN
jgi:hypothetical protein